MIWFKHPNDLPNDKRLAALIDNEGCRGYGMYLRIIEMLCAQPDRKLSFSQLNIISRKGFSKNTWRKSSGNTNFSLSTKKNLNQPSTSTIRKKEIICKMI